MTGLRSYRTLICVLMLGALTACGAPPCPGIQDRDGGIGGTGGCAAAPLAVSLPLEEGTVAGPDTDIDTGPDTRSDTGPDTGPDTRLDMGPDTRLDTGPGPVAVPQDDAAETAPPATALARSTVS